MSSKDLDQSTGDRGVAKFLSFLERVLKPMRHHPDAYVYVACLAIGAGGAAFFTVARESGSLWVVAAGVVCSLGWAYRPRRVDLVELQQLRNLCAELRKQLPRMIAEHVLRRRDHAEIFFERELNRVSKAERDDHLNDRADEYHERWRHINNVLYNGKHEPGAREKP